MIGHPSIAQPSDNIWLVQQFLAALSGLDIDGALTMLSDEIIYQNVPFPADRGKRAVARTLGYFTRLDVFDVRIHNIAERDGTVLTERTDIARGKLLDLSFWVCGTFEVKDGKIALWRDRFDVGAVLLQFASSPLRRLLRR